MLFTDVQRSVRLNKKKKSTNTSPYPDEVIDRLARAFYPVILACWNSEEGQRSLVGATPLHLLSQTALPLKSPTGAFIAPLRFANAVPPQTLLRLFTANWKLSVIKYQQQIPLSNDSPVRVCLYWNCALLLLSTSKEFSYCDAMLCCTVYTNQRDLVCRISATPDT